MAKYEKVGEVYRRKKSNWGGIIVVIVIILAIAGQCT